MDMNKEIEEIEKTVEQNSTATESNMDSKTEEGKDNKPENIVVTPTQQEILKELTKIEIEIEKLDNQEVNEDEFYDKLDELLTDEEKYLQEEDHKAYLKLLDKKKKEFIKNSSNDEKRKELLEKRNDLELRNAIEIGVVEVTKIYKDYNHNEMQNFFKKKLTEEEQENIIKTSKTTTEMFKKTHEAYLEKSGKKAEIKTTPLPNTPDLSKVATQPVKSDNLTAIDSEEEKYKRALGVK